jgi:ABC-2 type transport system ATP-binding protein
MELPELVARQFQESHAFIEVAQLTTRFAEMVAVYQISFGVRDGELFGFLGPNGAGKMTTIKLLTRLAGPDCSTILIGGINCARDPKAAPHLIGFVPDESNVHIPS